MPDSEILVDVAAIRSVLIGGAWTNVRDVVVSFAEFTTTDAAGVRTTHARGPHLAATIQGGPHNGERFVAPIGRIDAVGVS